jgi:hypothetical protein
METSDHESADDETYRMSQMLALENSVEEEDEGDAVRKFRKKR